MTNKNTAPGFSDKPGEWINHPFEERASKENRQRLSGPAIRAFTRISEEWGLTVSDQRALLGFPAQSTLYKWRKSDACLPYDTLERISLILGIYKALQLIFVEKKTRNEWLKSKNREEIFCGKSPLSIMRDGGMLGLYSVRKYLDNWRGVWN